MSFINIYCAQYVALTTCQPIAAFHEHLDHDTNANNAGCPGKNAPQFLLNFSGYIHARRLGIIGKVGSIALSGVQKLFCTIFGSRYTRKLKWGIISQNV